MFEGNAIQLKAGNVTYDRRLDRIVQFDERSKAYSVRKMLGYADPNLITWRCLSHLDQGQEGACVGFGWSHELSAQPMVIGGVTDRSAHELYKLAQTMDEWPGEDYEGTSVLAGAKAAQNQGHISGYAWAFSLEELQQAVQHGPVVMGTSWLESMFYPLANGVLTVTGSVVGGHCWLIRGYRPKIRLQRSVYRSGFFCRNSWGRGWGLGGDFYVLDNDMDELIKMGADMCIPTDVKGRI